MCGRCWSSPLDQTVERRIAARICRASGAPPLGLFIDDGKLDTHTATVDWGDGSARTGSTSWKSNGSGAIVGTHTYNDNGKFKVIVTVTDDDGGSDTKSFFVTVGNVAPTANFTNNGPVDEGSSATVSFQNQFDPSSVDTAAGFRYAYDLDNDGTFDVGDGTYGGSTPTSSQMVSAALLAEGPGTRTVRAGSSTRTATTPTTSPTSRSTTSTRR